VNQLENGFSGGAQSKTNDQANCFWLCAKRESSREFNEVKTLQTSTNSRFLVDATTTYYQTSLSQQSKIDSQSSFPRATRGAFMISQAHRSV